jgi:uncharacterized protein YqhQ
MIRQDKLTMYFILIIVSVVCFALVYWNFISIGRILNNLENRIVNLPQIKEGDIVEIRKTKNQIVGELKLLQRPFGDWPITVVTLSVNRGNPFVAK